MHVNTHIHTPYSFSSFDTIEQAVALASEEGVVVLGVNDLHSVEGYREFETACEKSRIFPVFGIEFKTISPYDVTRGFRWNDPENPGFMYVCGKGLQSPVVLSTDSKNLLASIWKKSQDRIWKMIQKLNEYMHRCEINCLLDYNAIRNNYAHNAVSERHVAKALYLEFVRTWNDPQELVKAFRLLFNDPVFDGDFADAVMMQHEIRERLLKVGREGYIEENDTGFLSFNEARKIILEAGGIPSYLMLLDEQAGFTEYERDYGVLADALIDKGIYSVEFISSSIAFDTLKQYARYFYNRGFCVTFGTGHNTPERISLVPTALHERMFDEELRIIGYEGACVIAAHQKLHRQNHTGFIDKSGKLMILSQQRNDFIRTGDEVIKKYTRKV